MSAEIVSFRDSEGRRRALHALQREGVIVLPTDTLYGLSAAASSADAVARIRAIKRVPDDHPFLLVADSVATVARYAASFGCVSRETLERAWPAPLTAILPAGGDRPPWVGATIAFRVPRHDRLRALVTALGEPVVSTSVNRSGEPPLVDIDAIARAFGAQVDLIVRDDDGARTGVASTIVDLTGSAPRVVRRGDYDWPTDSSTGGVNPSK